MMASEKVPMLAEGYRLLEDELKRLATMSLADLKFKKGYWRVICRPIEVERYSDGYAIEKFVMFSDVVMVQGDK